MFGASGCVKLAIGDIVGDSSVRAILPDTDQSGNGGVGWSWIELTAVVQESVVWQVPPLPHTNRTWLPNMSCRSRGGR